MNRILKSLNPFPSVLPHTKEYKTSLQCNNVKPYSCTLESTNIEADPQHRSGPNLEGNVGSIGYRNFGMKSSHAITALKGSTDILSLGKYDLITMVSWNAAAGQAEFFSLVPWVFPVVGGQCLPSASAQSYPLPQP